MTLCCKDQRQHSRNKDVDTKEEQKWGFLLGTKPATSTTQWTKHGILFEVTNWIPFTHTSLPTLQLASVSFETHGCCGSSPTSHDILCQSMTSLWHHHNYKIFTGQRWSFKGLPWWSVGINRVHPSQYKTVLSPVSIPYNRWNTISPYYIIVTLIPVWLVQYDVWRKWNNKILIDICKSGTRSDQLT